VFAVTEPTDSDQWLEEVEGAEALTWVRAQNQRSLAELRSDPRFENFHTAALDIATSRDRIPYGAVRDGIVYNFWQDDEHVRGLWRRTPLESFSTSAPTWETLLDVDALAAAENANWVFKGANVHRSHGDGRWLCTVSLSDGGKDAVVQREFDLQSGSFVDGGFATPEAKQGLAWVDRDTVLLATDWGEGTLTDSGYPAVVKRWDRGTPLDSAEELFRGRSTDVGVWPFTLEKENGTLLTGAVQSDTFFTSTYWLFTDGTTVRWPIPPKSSPNGIYRGRFLFTLEQDWEAHGIEFRSGELVAFDLERFLTDHQLPPVEVVFSPDERQAVNGVAVADGACLLSINDNVVAKLYRMEPPSEAGGLSEADDRGAWVTTAIDLPGTGQGGIAFADRHESTVFLNYEDFLTPSSLLRYEISDGSVRALKSLPSSFGSDGLLVEQFTTTSADGTQVPYFVVRREDIPFDGSTPTLLYGYGGFQISLGPSYSGNVGRLWMEEGGAYVLANIRGGGEFGPAWHQAGLKTNRQRIYDDFVAVAEAVIDQGLTSPRRLGIMGGSNGGLLMGVVLNQRPDLWNAVVIQVPLLDMLRFHQLLAGASWVDEYGSPDVAEERAFLETISPVHNFDPAKPYPMPFFVTSTKDDRVHPGHARKLARRFEQADLPFLYYENIDGGHSAAANQTEAAKRSALEFTYLHRRLF
jgi:prolyl oligopeptidase